VFSFSSVLFEISTWSKLLTIGHSARGSSQRLGEIGAWDKMSSERSRCRDLLLRNLVPKRFRKKDSDGMLSNGGIFSTKRSKSGGCSIQSMPDHASSCTNLGDSSRKSASAECTVASVDSICENSTVFPVRSSPAAKSTDENSWTKNRIYETILPQIKEESSNEGDDGSETTNPAKNEKSPCPSTNARQSKQEQV
jgi:hypothetical protein